MAKRRRQPSTRHYPRTARLNALLQRVVAGYFDRVEPDQLGLLTITGVEVDNDLNVAEVFVSILDDPEDPDHDAEILDALGSHRIPVQGAIARETQLRKTPEVVFRFDPAVRTGNRLEAILRDLNRDDPPEPGDGDGGS